MRKVPLSVVLMRRDLTRWEKLLGKVVGDHMIVFAAVGEVHLSTFG